MSDKKSTPARMLSILSLRRAPAPAVVPSTGGGMMNGQMFDGMGYEAAALPADFKPFATLKEARKGKHDAPAA